MKCLLSSGEASVAGGEQKKQDYSPAVYGIFTYPKAFSNLPTTKNIGLPHQATLCSLLFYSSWNVGCIRSKVQYCV